ncbi:MAG: LEA type 2 family protein [bacterium]
MMMHFKKSIWVGILIVALIVVMGSFYLLRENQRGKALKSFKISIVDVRVTGIGLTGANLEIVFNIRNPSGMAVTLDQLDYEIYGNNIYLGEGKINNAINVPAHSNSMVSSSFVLNYSSADKVFGGDLAKGTINWKISGIAYRNTPFGGIEVPFEETRVTGGKG